MRERTQTVAPAAAASPGAKPHSAEETVILAHTSSIVAAYVAHHAVTATALPELIQSVYGALTGLSGPSVEAPAPKEELRPAVPIKKSIATDYLICLEDGKKFKSLKRHLRTHYNLSPEEYRAKWGLPDDYPMVAPSYSERRSRLAKDNGLGRKVS